MRRLNGTKRRSYPVGAQRVDDRGYLLRKVTDTGRGRRDWREEHVLVWESFRGPVPHGHVIAFKDSNKAHIEIGNLECIPRAQLMARNSIANLPADLKEVMWLKGALIRRINAQHK